MEQFSFDISNLPGQMGQVSNQLYQALPGIYNDIGEIVLSSIEENFKQQSARNPILPEDTHGGAWKPLAESTKKRRGEDAKILQDKGLMAAAFQKLVNDDGVAITNASVQFAIMNFGGKAGRNHSVTIPARPMLVLQQEDIEDIEETVINALQKAAQQKAAQ